MYMLQWKWPPSQAAKFWNDNINSRGEYSSRKQIFSPNATMLWSKLSPNFPHFLAFIPYFLDWLFKTLMAICIVECGMIRVTYLMLSKNFCFSCLFLLFIFCYLIFSHHLKIFPKWKIFPPIFITEKWKNIHPWVTTEKKELALTNILNNDTEWNSIQDDHWIQTNQSARLQFSGVLTRCVYFSWESKCYCHFLWPNMSKWGWYQQMSLICDSTYPKVPIVRRLYFELWGCKGKISQIMVPKSISHILEFSILNL